MQSEVHTQLHLGGEGSAEGQDAHEGSPGGPDTGEGSGLPTTSGRAVDGQELELIDVGLRHELLGAGARASPPPRRHSGTSWSLGRGPAGLEALEPCGLAVL